MAILYFFCVMVPKYTKNEGVTAFYRYFDFILNRENQCHGFIFALNDLNFFVQDLRSIMQKIYKIAIVKFCL